MCNTENAELNSLRQTQTDSNIDLLNSLNLKIISGIESNEFSRKTSVFKQPNLTEYIDFDNINDDQEIDEEQLMQRSNNINNADRETFGKRDNSMAGSSLCRLEDVHNFNNLTTEAIGCPSLNNYIGKDFSNQFYNNKYGSNSINYIDTGNYHTEFEQHTATGVYSTTNKSIIQTHGTHMTNTETENTNYESNIDSSQEYFTNKSITKNLKEKEKELKEKQMELKEIQDRKKKLAAVTIGMKMTDVISSENVKIEEDINSLSNPKINTKDAFVKKKQQEPKAERSDYLSKGQIDIVNNKRVSKGI